METKAHAHAHKKKREREGAAQGEHGRKVSVLYAIAFRNKSHASKKNKQYMPRPYSMDTRVRRMLKTFTHFKKKKKERMVQQLVPEFRIAEN